MHRFSYFIPGLFCFLFLGLNSGNAIKNRFPIPAELQIEDTDKTIEQLAKDEVFTLSPSELAVFLWDIFKRGRSEEFSYYDSNPNILSVEQAKKPATILLHGHSSNQGEWLPFLASVEEYNKNCLNNEAMSGPIFTINYPEESSTTNLIKKIAEIKNIYLQAGQENVELFLVGHSLGAITSASYTYNPQLWVKGTHVRKVISIAGRLKNIDPPSKTPYYAYCYLLLPYIDEIWHKIEKNRGISHLYTIAAENDWLLPLESVLVGDELSENTIIPNAGHALVARKKETAKKVISWLYK